MSYVRISEDPNLVYSDIATAKLGKNYWYLSNDVNYTINNDKDTYEFLIEKGYLTDGATVPRMLWSIVPLWDECTAAVVAHDFLCNYGWVVKNGRPARIGRDEIDKLFLLILDNCNVPKIKYWMMYVAVRTFAVILNHDEARISDQKLELQKQIQGTLTNK